MAAKERTDGGCRDKDADLLQLALDSLVALTQYCLRGHGEAPPQVAWRDSTCCRQENPVAPPEPLASISAKHVQLMATDQDIELVGSIIGTPVQLLGTPNRSRSCV